MTDPNLGPGDPGDHDAPDDPDARLRDDLEATFRVTVRALDAVAGGDVNRVFHVAFEDGLELFVKTNLDPPPGLFRAEAHGLDVLGQTGTISVPKVVLAAPDDAFLALGWVEQGRATTDFDEVLGRELAALHHITRESFGLDRDNYIATLPQDNTAAATWPEFYATRRLEPMVRRAIDTDRLPADCAPRFDALYLRLDDLCGPPEPPSLIHGDLWGGNMMVAADGGPLFIDPAVYAGHREMDLAMMILFGGFDPITFASYDERHPLADGHRERVKLCQLYPLLVHANLFGGSYGRSVLSALATYE